MGASLSMLTGDRTGRGGRASGPQFSVITLESSDKEFRASEQEPSPLMAPSAEPTAILSHLHRADGSATFSQNSYTVIGAVNGPLEVQRRDELPEEAVVDVIVRPAAGVGGPSFQSRASRMWAL